MFVLIVKKNSKPLNNPMFKPRTIKFCISRWNTNNITQNILVSQLDGQLYILFIYYMQ